MIPEDELDREFTQENSYYSRIIDVLEEMVSNGTTFHPDCAAQIAYVIKDLTKELLHEMQAFLPASQPDVDLLTDRLRRLEALIKKAREVGKIRESLPDGLSPLTMVL